MKSLKTLFKIEFLMSIREFSGVLFGIIIPAGLMMLLGVLYGDGMAQDGSGASLLQQAFPAVITISIAATGLMGLPLTISGYREKKLLLRFKVTPTSPLTLLFANFINQFVFVLMSVLGVFLIAFFMYGYRMPGNVFAFILTFLIVLTSTYSLGMLIASVAKNTNQSNLLCSLLYFPTFFLSGATVPYEIMPGGLKAVANILPLTHGIKTLKAISLGSNLGEYAPTLITLLIVAIICIIVSARTFRYDY